MLRDAGVPSPPRQAVVAALALAGTAVAIGYQLAGAADWLPALAVLAALPALLVPVVEAGGTDDLTIGLAAAFAAASKIEGVPLAAALVGVQLVRHLREGGIAAWRAHARTAAALALPPLVVLAHWAWRVRARRLYQQAGTSHPSLALWRSLRPRCCSRCCSRRGTSLPFLVLLLPALATAPRLRPFVAVAALQLAFVVWIYAATPLDPAVLALTSFPRLLLHLLPAIIVASAVAWLREPG